MSLDAFIGYLWFDSVMRSLTSHAEVDSLKRQLNSFDTIKQFLRYYYALTDYDAILFRDYLSEGYYVNSSYPFSPLLVSNAVQSRIGYRTGVSAKIKFLVSSGPILHIVADDVELQSHNYGGPARDSIHTFACIMAHVLDTIKGRHFLSGPCYDGYHSKKGGRSNESASLPTESCITFSYDTSFFRGPNNSVMYIDHDSLGNLLPCIPCYGSNAAISGGEYIVSLIPYPLGRDTISDFYSYVPFAPYEKTGGIFPVIEGNVQDPSNFFVYGTSVPIADFENDIKADISTIQSY